MSLLDTNSKNSLRQFAIIIPYDKHERTIQFLCTAEIDCSDECI